MTEQLEKFKDSLYRIASGDYDKKVTQKYDEITKAAQLFDDEPLRELLCNDEEGYPEVMKNLTHIVSYECSENEKKFYANKKSTAYHFKAFDLYASMIRFQCKVLSQNIHFDDLIEGISVCFSNMYLLRSASSPCTASWITTLELIADVFSIYPPIDLDFGKFKSLWELLMDYSKQSFANGNKTERCKLVNIIAHIAPKIHSTYFFTQIKPIIASIADLVDTFAWQQKDPTRLALLNVVNALIENNSERHRDFLLEKFYHLAEELVSGICVVGPNDAKLSSPRKDDRYYTNVNDSDYHGSLYRFIENILILSYPDCELNSLNLKAASHVVDQCYDRFMSEIQDKSNKGLSSGRKFIISKCRLPLLSRVCLLKHSLRIGDSILSQPSSAKRAKTLSPLSQLVNDGQYCHFQIILELVTSWRHRLRSEDLDDLVLDLVKVNRKILKKDDKLELFMRILGSCLIDKRDIPAADYDELWNWAISLLQIPAIQEAACIALSGIIHYYEEVLTAKPDDLFKVLIFQIAQFSVYSKPALDLIHLVITKFEFDERVSFRVDLQNSCPEWTFRSQLLFAILKFSPFDADVDDLLMATMNYHPHEICCRQEKTILQNNNFESMIAEMYCIATKKITRDKKISHSCENSIPLLVDCLVNYLSEIWESLLESGEFGEKQIFLWKICCFSKKVFELPICNDLLKAFEKEISRNIANPQNQHILEMMDIGNLWEQTNSDLRDTVTAIAEESDSPLCQRYQFFWGDTVSLSKELLDAESIGQSQNIDILISTNWEILSFNDLILIISKFSSVLKPETNEALIKQLIKEIEQEVQLGGDSDLAECLNQRFLFAICRYIDLHSISFCDSLKRFLLVNPNVVAELSSKFPMFYFTEHDLEAIIPNLTPLQFSRLFLSALENMKNEYIPIEILKRLLSHSYDFMVEFVPDFEKYVSFWKPLLAFYRTSVTAVNHEWELKLPNSSTNLLHLRLTGKSTVVDYTYSPAIFTFPVTIIETLLFDPAFKDNWLQWEDQSFIFRTLRNLRCFIFNLRTANMPYLNYPLIILRTILHFLQNGFSFGTHTDDIASIITSLFFDAVKFCSDQTLSSLVLDFANVIDACQIAALRALVVVDILFDNYEKFPQTIQDLKENCKNGVEASGLNWFHEYIAYKEMISFPERNLNVPVPSFILTEVYDLIETKKFEPDLPGYHFQLFGFWEALYKHLEEKPDIDVLNTVIPFWMFFPRLRPALTKVIVLFPSIQIDSILRDYRFFMKALSEHSDFRTFVPEFVLVIAFDPTVLYEESITKAIYDVLCASLMQISQPLSQYIEPETEDEISPSNYAGLILKNLADCIPSKPWMFKFLSMVYKIPLCANLALIRFLKTSNEQSCKRLIELLNSTFYSLLMEDNEKMKSRHPSTATQYSNSASFPMNTSFMNTTLTGSSEAGLSTKNCSVFESENAIMFLFAAVNLTEMLYEHIHLFDLKLFSTCLLRAKMFKEAYFFLKLLIDSSPNENRASFAFRKPGSFVEVIEDEELKTLITDALIGLKDYQSLSQMPLHLRTKNNARALIAECKHDWGAMASICNTAEDKDTQAKALLALGSLPSGCSKELKYEAVVQLSSWNDPGNAVSFPKRAISHWEQLYSVIKKHKDGKTFKTSNFLNSSLETIASKTIIDPFQLTCCRHLFLLQNLVQNRACFIPDGVLRCSFHLANISQEDNDEQTFENAVTAVVDQSKNLRKKGASLLSLKLLDAFDLTTKKSTSKLLRSKKAASLSSVSLDIAIERAKTLVANNDPDMAAFLLTELTENNKRKISKRIAKNVSRAYKLLGKLQPENCQNHLTVACTVTAKNELYHKNLLKLAIFSENNYQTTQDYMESSAFKLKQEFVADCASSPEPDKSKSKGLSREEKLQHHVLKMEKNVEENEIKLVKERRLQSLTFCVENYIKAVINGSQDKTIAYRIVALMIQNTDETQLMNLIKNNLNSCPTNFWLPVLNVLSSHLFSDKLPICDVVEDISLRTIGDYPYIATRHFLFYLSDPSTNVHGSCPRHETLKKLFEKCHKRSPHAAKIVQNLIKADKCFIEVGTSEFQNSVFFQYVSNSKYEMTEELKIFKHIEHMRKIPIPTVPQLVFPPGDSRNYDVKEFITIKSIEKFCFEAGGLSKPKVLHFYGSNDKKYKLIFKGEDLRQDSLVQQLFSVQNLIMEQNQRPSSSFSPLRTYSVIPLSPQCGIIEFCEGTVSLCSYLIGDNKDGGAHAQYYPNDILAIKCQQTMKSRQNGYNSTEVFLDICRKIQPVFRYFFYSKFNNSKDFHEAIDRYTQSLAQWSIVCYVVGLGDRHLNNILIDEKRGELVHIDLGQIFEFSKRSLPIPERIPFRLTRDLVDPLLIDGVYGHLKDIAVHTMKCMRENARVIVGIASSLVHDPVSTFAAVSSQTNNRHFVAEAAISRLQEKLAGRDSSLYVLTPEQQVLNLIQDAMNPDNLSKVFCGWMPFI